jgi:hypothetical protein
MGHHPQSRNQEQKNRGVLCEGANEAGDDCDIVVLNPSRLLILQVVVGKNCEQQDKYSFAVNELEVVVSAGGCK